MKPSENKKQNYASPQKTQTSIVTYTNQKKINNNPTPPRTAIERSYNAILSQTPCSPLKAGGLSNNPYRLLADNNEEHEETELDTTQASEISEDQASNDLDSKSDASLKPPEKCLLSRKAQQTIRKIRSLRKALMDTSLCSEIEAVLGPDSLDSVSQEGSQCSKTSNSSDKPEGPQEEGKVDDMIVDQEDTSNKTEASNSLKDLPSAEQETPPQEQPVSTSDDQQEVHLNVPPILGSQRNSVPPSTGQAIQCTRNVSFAATEGGKPNSHNLRGGNLQRPAKVVPANPYEKHQQTSKTGVLYPQPTPQPIAKPDKAITLKKNASRPHIHRYTLQFETIKEKTEEEAHQLVKETLQRFLDIVL